MNGPAPSPYYPPRAGRARRALPLWYSLRKRLGIEELNLRLGTTVARFALSALLPGFSFLDAGWSTIGRTMIAAWTLAAFVYFAWLGYAAANIAFGLMVSLHVSSAIYLINRLGPRLTVVRRLILSLGVLFVIGQLVYFAGQNWIHERWLMPLRVGDRVYVINRLNTMPPRRGELVACMAEQTAFTGVYIRGGYVLDRVLALPGDHVAFELGTFSVNGVSASSRAHMPWAGSFAMPPNTWLVWPSLSTVTEYNVAQERIADTVLQMAMISRDEIIGKPFKRWFWRNQSQ